MEIKSNKPLIIAEIGWNFLGDLNLAKKMILSAKNCGVDAVKFQLWNPKNLKNGAWDNDGRRNLYNKSYLDYKKFNLLFRYSKKKKLNVLLPFFQKKILEYMKKLIKKLLKFLRQKHTIFL